MNKERVVNHITTIVHGNLYTVWMGRTDDWHRLASRKISEPMDWADVISKEHADGYNERVNRSTVIIVTLDLFLDSLEFSYFRTALISQIEISDMFAPPFWAFFRITYSRWLRTPWKQCRKTNTESVKKTPIYGSYARKHPYIKGSD